VRERGSTKSLAVEWAGASTLYLGFDVQKPPFDDIRVRQALNYARDRNHIVELLGGRRPNG
jgi:ABC-type oligopeptide transport system substrate-binding subunit